VPTNFQMIQNKNKVVGDRVLLKHNTSETRMVGGVYIPSSVKENIVEAVVVHAGLKCEHAWQENTRVLVGKTAGVVVKLDIGEHVVVKEGDILVIL
jgi:co-chaperonin GroES (HSP10)